MRYDFWKKPRRFKQDTAPLFDLKLFVQEGGKRSERGGWRWIRDGVTWDAFHYHPNARTLAEDIAAERTYAARLATDPFHGLRFGKDWLNMGQGIVWAFAKPSRARTASGTLGDAGPS